MTARPLIRALLGALIAALLVPAAAAATGHDEVFDDYTRDGRINPCAHTPAELREAQRETPRNIASFAPEFPEALRGAISSRAGADCAEAGDGEAGAVPGGGATGGASPAQPAPAPAPAPNPTPEGQTPNPGGTTSPAPSAADGAIAEASRSAARDAERGVPFPLVALAVLGALVVLAGLLVVALRLLAWEPRWALVARHAMAEGGHRMGGAWGDFHDWARTRRTPAPR